MGPGDSRVELKWSKLPKMAGQVSAAADSIIENVANQILAQIRSTAPVKDIPVTLKRSKGNVTVVVGSGRKFWVGFVEYGTVDQSARPFVTPAAESHRPGFISDMRHLERDLT